MRISVGDVIFLFDDLTTPPKYKYQVCVSVGKGFFLRINTKKYSEDSIVLLQKSHPFLKHDSYIDCRFILEEDEYLLRKATLKGRLSHQAIGNLITAITECYFIAPRQKEEILKELKASCTE